MIMKKQLLLILMLLLPMMASAQIIDGIRYNLNNETKTAEVTTGFKKDACTGNFVIPEKVIWNETEYTVTSIGYGAFSGCSELTSITIPNSVTSIGTRSFYDCI